ncbi:hypothetical protein Sjap_015085 [Stephania japonica]|uniref:Pentatricopeptide repeat-containing protein n=1 Tax=Stephania japonica TaxID=461633 RepID=A0AAP0NR21_9MAGN
MHYDAGSVPNDSDFMPFLLDYMIIRYCRLRRFDKAKKSLNELIELGCYPSSTSYDLLIHGLSRNKFM